MLPIMKHIFIKFVQFDRRNNVYNARIWDPVFQTLCLTPIKLNLIVSIILFIPVIHVIKQAQNLCIAA